MNEEIIYPPSREEAQASLAEVDHMLAQTRRTIAEGMLAPSLILWGAVWMVMLAYAQFHRGPNHLWWAFILAGFIGSGMLQRRYPAPVKKPANGRVAKIGVAMVVVFGYALLLLGLVEPWSLLTNLAPADQQMMDLKISAYFIIVPMSAYVLLGLWAGRFFVWLGLLETALVIFGYNYLPGYFYLWVALLGGGSMIASGIFIRKFWK